MPPGRGKRSRGVRGGNDRIRRTDNFLNFYCAAGVNTRPTIQNKHQTDPATADARTVLRAACMPPLRIDQTPSRPKKRHGKQAWRAACMRPLQTVVNTQQTIKTYAGQTAAAGSAPAGAFRTGAAAPFRSATGPQGPALSAEMANRRAAAAS